MSLRDFAAAEAAQSVRRIDFNSVEVVGDLPGGDVLIVCGEAPCLNMEVRLSPLIITCPDYWGIGVLGSLPGSICLTAMKPFKLAVRLDGMIGYKGIEVLGANRSEKIDVAGSCRQGDAYE